MATNDPKALPINTLRAWLARFRKGTSRHCYILNVKAVGLMVLEKIFKVVPQYNMFLKGYPLEAKTAPKN